MSKIKQVIWGERVGAVVIHEDNRQSVWESDPEQIAILCRICDRLNARGVEAIVATLYNPTTQLEECAIFVEEGFLVA